MNTQNIADRIAAKVAMENDLGLDPLAKKVAVYFDGNEAASDDEFHQWCKEQGLDKHHAEAAAYRLAAIASSFLLHGRAEDDEVTDEDVDPNELAMGIEIEMEHTSSAIVAKRIALDHLAELDDYYTRLKEMEESAGVEH